MSATSRADLKDAALKGARWVTLGRVLAEATALVSSVALARLLTPGDFGRAAIALAVVAVAGVLTFEGIGTSLVQRREVERRHLEAAAMLALMLGGIVAGAVATVGALVGSPLLQLAALSFVLGAIGLVPRALLQRGLDFRRISLIEVAGIVANMVVAVGLALAGAGAAAVVVGALTMTATTSLLFLCCTPLTIPRWHRRAAGEIAGFGVPAALSSLTWSVYRNIDYAIVAARLGHVQLGYYWRGFQLGVQYQQKISGILGRLAFPVLSRASSAEDRRALRFRIVRVHTALIFPLLVLFVVVAPDVVPFVFGEAWEPSVAPARILAIAALASPVLAGVGAMMMASGRPKAMLGVNVAFLGVYATAIFFASAYGIAAVCWATVGVNAVKLVTVQYLLLDRLLGIPTRQVLRDVAPAAASSLLLLAVAVPVHLAVGGMPGAVLACAVGVAAYAAALRLLFRGAWEDLRSLARRASARGGGAADARPPRIAITNAVALNTGDAAILKSLVVLLRRALGERADFVVYESQPEAAAARYPELRFRALPYVRLGTSHRTGRAGRLARRVRQRRVLAAAWLWGRGLAPLAALLTTRSERAVLRECASVDAVVSTGGTYLVETYRLEPRLFEFRLALALRKPLILYTQSLGPFRHPRLRRSLRRLLTRAELVLLRDERSREHLVDIGVPEERLAVSADAAFALAEVDVLAAARARRSGSARTPGVAISVRRWHKFAAADGMERYERAIADLTVSLVERHGAEVCFLSTCQGIADYWLDDSQVAQGIAARLPAHVAARVSVDSNFHPPEALMERLRDFDLVVATRMHVAILALGAGVPVLPVAYEFKTQALFARLGFASLVVPIDEVDGARLAQAAERILRDRAAISELLFDRVLAERARALESAQLVRTAYAEARR